MSTFLSPEVFLSLMRAGAAPLVLVLTCAVAALIVALVPFMRSSQWRLAIGALSLLCILREQLPAYLVTMSAALVLAHVIERTTKAREHRWHASCAALLFLATGFLWTRRAGVQEWQLTALGFDWPMLFLDMWTVLRLATLFWELGSGKITAPAPARFSAWALLPFTIAGPVLRFSELPAESDGVDGTISGVALNDYGWWRKLAIGLTQIGLGLALPVGTDILTQTFPTAETAVKGLRIFFVNPWAFLFITAGTFLTMESLALVWGIKIPQSFNKPFGRANISDFWANWNMTATRFFRDALFFNRWGMRKTNIYLNAMLVFLLCGAWHSFNWYWLLWGGLHGLFFCAFLWMKQSPFARTRAGKSLVSGRLGSVVTYVFVCLAWYIPSKVIIALTS